MGPGVSRTEVRKLQHVDQQRVAGYLLEDYIGQGDCAAVHRARDERLGRAVAVKILVPELARDAAFRTRLFRESRAAAAIGHPGILPVYEAGDAAGTVYLAMRYVRGGDVRSLLNRLGPPPPSSVWQVIAQVAAALDAAHAHGLIHRDVKPANMLLEAVDGGAPASSWADYDLGHVYLADFGMSRDAPPESIIATGQYAGTLDYLSPEQVRERDVDGRADLYSLACAAFEMLCGMPPFGQDQGLTVLYAQLYAPPPAVTALRPGLPAAVDKVLATALAKDPADRYASCGEFAAEMGAALGLGGARSGPGLGLGDGAGPPGSGEPGSGSGEAVGSAAGPGGPEPDSGPGAPGGRDFEDGPGRVRTRLRSVVIMLILAAVVAAAAAVTTNLVLMHRRATAASSPAVTPSSAPASSAPASSSPPASSASPTPVAVLASRQAAAVNTLLGSSAATRAALQRAVSQAGNCANVSGAVGQIQDVVNERSAEYNQAKALVTSALADGATLKSDLLAALRDSLNADRDYLSWARQQQNPGCTPSAPSSTFTAAYNADQQAGSAKEAFLRVWNPVAARYGLPQKSPASI